MRNTTYFKRGQVWFINDNLETKGAIICKSRPYLVVSNDLCNSSSSIIHMAPITSKLKRIMPTNVVYEDSEERMNTILVGQITVKSVPHIKRCASYMYTLSDDIMDLVEKAILHQFNLDTETRETSDGEDYTYSQAVREIAVSSEYEESSECDVIHIPSQIEKFNARMAKYKALHDIQAPPEVDISRTKSGRIRWTTELKIQFIRDAVELCESEVLEKYHLKKSTYRTTLSKFRGEMRDSQ